MIKGVFMNNIKIIGMDKIEDEQEQITIERLSGDYYDKIQRLIKNEISLVVHLKTYSKGGKQKEWEIKAKVKAPTKGFEAEESDWDLARTLHKVFKDIIRQVEKRFKV